MTSQCGLKTGEMKIFSLALAVSLGLKWLRISRRRSREKEKVGGEARRGEVEFDK